MARPARLLALLPAASALVCAAPAQAASEVCGRHWVAAWAAPPSDAADPGPSEQLGPHLASGLGNVRAPLAGPRSARSSPRSSAAVSSASG